MGLTLSLGSKPMLRTLIFMVNKMSSTFEEYQGCTALITGSSSGIGKAYAKRLARDGIHLILTARSEQALHDLANELREKYSIKVDVIVLDLSELDGAQQLYKQIEKKNRKIDILINNAGFGKWSKFLDQSLQTYQEMMILNMLNMTQLCHLVLPSMLANKKGILINISSTGAFQPLPYIAVYGATKSFVLNFTEALAGEYAQSGIQCLAVCPGNTATNFAQVAQANTENMKSSSVEDVVDATIYALDQNKSSIIVGMNNYWTAQLSRILPRQQMINLVSNMFKKRIA